MNPQDPEVTTTPSQGVQSDIRKPQLFPNKKILLVGVALILFIVCIVIFALISAKNFVVQPPTEPVQKPFKVVSTSPQNGEKNVFAGELQLTVNTDEEILKNTSLTVVLAPATRYPLQFGNSFPTKKIQLQILGHLDSNTHYTAKVFNQEGKNIYSWSFTTSNERGESESKLNAALDKQLEVNYYPLSKYFPYSTSTYKLGYKDRLFLKITLLDQRANKESILNEVKNWVKSKGVDPASHQYEFSPS